jgi:hypothetical protein
VSKSNTWENQLLLLVFNNTNAANIGDATGLRASTVAGSLYLALHTADPGDAGTQATSECTVGGYARVAVARSAGGFTVAANVVTLTAAVDFPEVTSGSQTVTHFSVGVASSGATAILYSGTLDVSLLCDTGKIPRLKTGTNITED